MFWDFGIRAVGGDISTKPSNNRVRMCAPCPDRCFRHSIQPSAFSSTATPTRDGGEGRNNFLLPTPFFRRFHGSSNLTSWSNTCTG